MAFPDLIDKPSRTIVTGEGGSSVSRFKHVVKVTNTKRLKTHKYRRLTPVELEKLNGFPEDWTQFALDPNDDEKKIKVLDSKRAFLMGNALVVDIVTKLAKTLYTQENKKNRSWWDILIW